MTNPNREAQIEAGAKALFDAEGQKALKRTGRIPGTWEQLRRWSAASYREQARIVLEAAAPLADTNHEQQQNRRDEMKELETLIANVSATTALCMADPSYARQDAAEAAQAKLVEYVEGRVKEAYESGHADGGDR